MPSHRSTLHRLRRRCLMSSLLRRLNIKFERRYISVGIAAPLQALVVAAPKALYVTSARLLASAPVSCDAAECMSGLSPGLDLLLFVM